MLATLVMWACMKNEVIAFMFHMCMCVPIQHLAELKACSIMSAYRTKVKSLIIIVFLHLSDRTSINIEVSISMQLTI